MSEVYLQRGEKSLTIEDNITVSCRIARRVRWYIFLVIWAHHVEETRRNQTPNNGSPSVIIQNIENNALIMSHARKSLANARDRSDARRLNTVRCCDCWLVVVSGVVVVSGPAWATGTSDVVGLTDGTAGWTGSTWFSTNWTLLRRVKSRCGRSY